MMIIYDAMMIVYYVMMISNNVMMIAQNVMMVVHNVIVYHALLIIHNVMMRFCTSWCYDDALSLMIIFHYTPRVWNQKYFSGGKTFVDTHSRFIQTEIK